MATARDIGRRRYACHHEAGHALARWYFGHRVSRIVVLTIDEARAAMRSVDPAAAPVLREAWTEADEIAWQPFAGPCPADGASPHAESDLRRVILRDIELIMCHAGIYAEAHYRRVSLFDVIIVGGDRDMTHANAILDAWGLSGHARTVAARAAESSASALVRSSAGASAIRAIAAFLMERGEIGGGRIAALCRAAYNGRQCNFEAWASCWPPTVKQLRAGYLPD